jgi:hypothetical protein
MPGLIHARRKTPPSHAAYGARLVEGERQSMTTADFDRVGRSHRALPVRLLGPFAVCALLAGAIALALGGSANPRVGDSSAQPQPSSIGLARVVAPVLAPDETAKVSRQGGVSDPSSSPPHGPARHQYHSVTTSADVASVPNKSTGASPSPSRPSAGQPADPAAASSAPTAQPSGKNTAGPPPGNHNSCPADPSGAQCPVGPSQPNP